MFNEYCGNVMTIRIGTCCKKNYEAPAVDALGAFQAEWLNESDSHSTSYIIETLTTAII